MLGSLDCHSAEKLVIDAESIASAMRLVRGIEADSDTLATGMFAQVGLSGEFLKLKETRTLFRKEQHIPSTVIDRGGQGGEAASDAFVRARARVEELVVGYRAPELSTEMVREFEEVVERASAVQCSG
jgi:trimethylamine:corrinoid methyltransferase-like protein